MEVGLCIKRGVTSNWFSKKPPGALHVSSKMTLSIRI